MAKFLKALKEPEIVTNPRGETISKIPFKELARIFHETAADGETGMRNG